MELEGHNEQWYWVAGVICDYDTANGGLLLNSILQ
jgi:hypothetical protein